MTRVIQDDCPVLLGHRQVRHIVPIPHGFVGRHPPISLVRTEMSLAVGTHFWHNQRVKQRLKLGHIMSIGAAHDER